jgi:CheY-like chemotaxis protein
MRGLVMTDRARKSHGHRVTGGRRALLRKGKWMVLTQSVLIIDDDAVNRRLAQVMFQKLGWCAETVASGEGALLHLAAHRYDLVLLDISMPGMNGMEVCQRIRANRALLGVRVVAYTAHALLGEQQRFLGGGFDDVLLKPIDFRALQELLMVQARGTRASPRGC